MPGIFGIVHAGNAPELLNRSTKNMVAPLLHFPWYQWTESRQPNAVLGLVSLGALTPSPHCLTSEDQCYLLAFEGELYNARELQKELGGYDLQNSGANPHAAVAFQALRRWGAAALERFNGLFQLAFWDSSLKELIVSGDRCGLRPVYVAQHEDKFAFAPEVKALLTLPWVSRAIDYTGILSFMRHGFCQGRRTFFQDVNVLPAGTFAIFRQGRLQIQRYWEMAFQPRASYDEKETQQRFIETWQEVMHAQTEGELRHGLLLSGGVDSRLILAALAAQKRNVLTFTVGAPGCKDAEVAKRVAETIGYANLFSPIVANEAASGLERAIYLTDGMQSCFRLNAQRLSPSLAESVSVIYDGITPLDQLHNNEELFWQPLARQTEPVSWLRARANQKKINALNLSTHACVNLFSAEAQSHLQQDPGIIDEFVQAQRIQNASVAAKSDHACREYFQTTFGPQILRSIVEVRSPFFDKRMLDLIGTWTPMQRRDHKPLQRAAIHALTPALSRIPWGRTGLALTAGFYKTQLRLTTNALQHRFNAALRRQARTNSTKMVDYDEMIRVSPRLQQKIAAIMIDRWPEGSRLFNRRSLHMLLEKHVNRRGNFAELFGRIITVEIWYRLFVRDTARLSHVATKTSEPIYHMAA